MARTGQMSHTGSDGSSPWDRMKKAGYTNANSMAENVAAGYQSESAVMDGWMNSPGHRANILGNFNEFGMGVKNNYWTQTFGLRSGVDVSNAPDSCAGSAPPKTSTPPATTTQPASSGGTATPTRAPAQESPASGCWDTTPQSIAEWIKVRERCNRYFYGKQHFIR